MRTYFAFDMETTGLQAGNRMVEFAAVAFDAAGTILGDFTTLVDPGMPIPSDAIAIHGITDDMVANAPDAQEALARFQTFVDDVVNQPDGYFFIDPETRPALVIHNAEFDVSVLGMEAARCGFAVPKMFGAICTLELAKLKKATKKNDLETLVAHYGIERTGQAHRALSDAHATREVLLKHDGWSAIFPAPFEEYEKHFYVPVELLEPVLPGFHAATAAGSTIRFTYADGDGQVTEREVTPYGCARRANEEIYFTGFCHLRGERRTFRLDRVAVTSEA